MTRSSQNVPAAPAAGTAPTGQAIGAGSLSAAGHGTLEGEPCPAAETVTEESPWRLSYRADPRTRVLADRHYNRQKIGAVQFVPPGACLVMRTADDSAAWITSWPKAEYVQHGWAGAWVNSLFRNEGTLLSSDLIRWAVAHARAVWPDVPGLGIVSFVDASKTEDKEVPGWCYRRAGWSHVGFTKGGLYVFQQLPGRKIGRRSKPMPEAAPIPGSQALLFEVGA